MLITQRLYLRLLEWEDYPDLRRRKIIRACQWNGEHPHKIYSLNSPHPNTHNV